MAIARDTFLARLTGSPGTSITRSMTITGSNTALVVFVEHDSAVTVSSVTYAGVTMTQVDNILAYTGTQISSYVLVGTSTGANNIVVTFSASTEGVTMAESYTGVASGASTGGCDAHATLSFSSSATNQTVSTTTASDNAWITVFFRANGGSYSAGTNVSLQDNVADIALMGDTGLAIVSPGATEQTFTRVTGTNSGGVITVALRPSSGVATPSFPVSNLLFMGV